MAKNSSAARLEARKEQVQEVKPAQEKLRELKKKVPGPNNVKLGELRREVLTTAASQGHQNVEAQAQASQALAAQAEQNGQFKEALDGQAKTVAAHQVSKDFARMGGTLETGSAPATSQERQELGRKIQWEFKSDVELVNIMQEEGVAPIDLVAGGDTTKRAIELIYANEPGKKAALLAQTNGQTPDGTGVWLELKARADELNQRSTTLKQITRDIDEGVHNPLLDKADKWGLKPLMENLNPMQHPMEALVASIGIYLAYKFISGEKKEGEKKETWSSSAIGWLKTLGMLGVGTVSINYFTSHYTKKGIGVNSLVNGYEEATENFQSMFNDENREREGSSLDKSFDDDRSWRDTVINMGHANVRNLVYAYQSAGAHGLYPELDIHSLRAQNPDNVNRDEVARMDNEMDRQAAYEGTETILVLYARKKMDLKGNDRKELAARACTDILQNYGAEGKPFELRLLIAEILADEDLHSKDTLLARGPEDEKDVQIQDSLKKTIEELGGSADIFVQSGKAYVNGYPFRVEGEGTKESPYILKVGAESFTLATAADVSKLTDKSKTLTLAKYPNLATLEYDKKHHAYVLKETFEGWKSLNAKGEEYKVYLSFNADGDIEYRAAEGSGKIYEKPEDLKEAETKAVVTSIIRKELAYSLGVTEIDFEKVTGPTDAGMVELEWNHGLNKATLTFANGHVTKVENVTLSPEMTAKIPEVAKREAESIVSSNKQIIEALSKKTYEIRESNKDSLIGQAKAWMPEWMTGDAASQENSATALFKSKMLDDVEARLNQALSTNSSMSPTEWEATKADVAKTVSGTINKHSVAQMQRGEYTPDGMIRDEHPEWKEIALGASLADRLNRLRSASSAITSNLSSMESYPILRTLFPSNYQLVVESWANAQEAKLERDLISGKDVTASLKQLELIVTKLAIEKDPEVIRMTLIGENLPDGWEANFSKLDEWLNRSFEFEGWSYVINDERIHQEISKLFKDKIAGSERPDAGMAEMYTDYFKYQLYVVLAHDLNWDTDSLLSGVSKRQVNWTEFDSARNVLGQIKSFAEFKKSPETAPSIKGESLADRQAEFKKSQAEEAFDAALAHFDSNLSLNGYFDRLVNIPGLTNQLGDMGWNNAFRTHYEARLKDLRAQHGTNVDAFTKAAQKLEAAADVEKNLYETLLGQSIRLGDREEDYSLVSALGMGLGAIPGAAGWAWASNSVLRVGLPLAGALTGGAAERYFDTQLPLSLVVASGEAFKNRLQKIIDGKYADYMSNTSTSALAAYRTGLTDEVNKLAQEAAARDSRLASLGSYSINLKVN